MRNVRAVTRLTAAAVALVGVAALAACTGPKGPGTTTTRPPTTPPPATRLVEYTVTGGLCPLPCGTELTINRDGSWQGRHNLYSYAGRLDEAARRDLAARIDAGIASLADLKPAPALCPSAYDGSDITFTFHVRPKPVTATNCDPVDKSRNRDVPGDNALLNHIVSVSRTLLSGTPLPGKTVVQYYERGGHCRETCPEVRATISATGDWTATSGPTSTTGTLTLLQLSELTYQLTIGMQTLGSLPPSSGCPSAYDGRDIDITFTYGGRTATVSNCVKDFEGNELIGTTIELVRSFT